MNRSLKVLGIAGSAASLLCASALPAQAQQRGNNGAIAGLVVGLAAGYVLAHEQPTQGRVIYAQQGCGMRVVGGQNPTFARNQYGQVFQTSSGYRLGQNTCTGEVRTYYPPYHF